MTAAAWLLTLVLGVFSLSMTAAAYPLDGFEATGIRRLRAFQKILAGEWTGSLRLPPGGSLGADGVRLRLVGRPDLDLGPGTARDPVLQAGLEAIFAARDPSYRVALLDITHPENPRFAALRAEDGYVPGSVGKLLVMAAVFHQIRLRFPDQPEERGRFLRQTMVTADAFTGTDHHRVPIVDEIRQRVEYRPVQPGDRMNLWEWLDHMISPSSNSAASLVWKEAVLMDRFGTDYPPHEKSARSYFRTSPPAERTERAVHVVRAPLEAAGLRFEFLRVQTLFTRAASRIIPGRSSYATPLELLRWLVRLEQGRMVDPWSSLEMKRLLYVTRPRYRYASSPALAEAAVYFKSESLFECEPEDGFRCGPYRGNRTNLMHSVAIVESPARGQDQVVYLVAIMFNVLRVDSAEEHQRIAGEIEGLLRGSRERGAGSQEPGDGRRETGVRRQESGVRRRESGDRSRETGVRKRETGAGRRESGNGSQETGVGSQETGAGRRESGNGSQETGVGSQEGNRGTGGGAEPLDRRLVARGTKKLAPFSRSDLSHRLIRGIPGIRVET